jgi:hypothetical protein
MITYRHTTVRKFRCRGCTGPKADEKIRLMPYEPRNFWLYITSHYIKPIKEWPTQCFYFGSTKIVSNKALLECYLKDAHYRAMRITAASQKVNIKKRKRELDDECKLLLNDMGEGNSNEILLNADIFVKEWIQDDIPGYHEFSIILANELHKIEILDDTITPLNRK